MKGQHLGAWELVDRLDEGPYGVTWSAVDATGRRARLLMLPEAASGELLFERLRRGASRAAAVDHDAFVPVTEVAQTADGRLWLTMDPAEGPSLDRLVRHRAMQFDDAVALIHQLLSALSAAHQQGLVHRMLSLACLELPERGPKKLRIRELWMANALTPELHLTLTGSANIGVPGFVAPEQVEGLAVDARTDLFAVGCIAFELLTGRPAVPGASAADRLVNVLRGGVSRVSRLRPEVPAWLDELVAQLLASSPSSRPATAAEAIFVIEGKRAEPRPIEKPVEFANQRVDLPRVETRVPDEVFGEVQQPPNLARAPTTASRRSPWVWVLVSMLAAVAVVGGYLLMPGRAIESPDHRGLLTIECIGCRDGATVQVVGPNPTTLALPARVRLPPGRYVLDVDLESVPLPLLVGPGEVVSARYNWIKQEWVTTR